MTLLNTDKDEYRRDVHKWDKIDHQQFNPFIGKKVTVEAEGPSGLFTRQGRIVIDGGTPVFIQKGHRSRELFVTSGLYDSFRSHMTVRKIKEGWD